MINVICPTMRDYYTWKKLKAHLNLCAEVDASPSSKYIDVFNDIKVTTTNYDDLPEGNWDEDVNESEQ